MIGATNDETERVNSAIDFSTGEEGTIPEVAKAYKARGQPWMIVTDVCRTSVSRTPGEQELTRAVEVDSTTMVRDQLASTLRSSPGS